MAGDYAACCYFQSIDSDENRQFVAQFRKKFGPQRVVTDPMEATYMGVKLWAAAVREANSLETRSVRQALRGMRMSSPAGEFRIDPSSQHVYKTPRIGQITEDGQFKIVWTADKPVAPEPYPAERSAEAWRAVLHDLQRCGTANGPAPEIKGLCDIRLCISIVALVAQEGAELCQASVLSRVAVNGCSFLFLDWLPRYQSSWLTHDAIAGITLAAYAIPVSMARLARRPACRRSMAFTAPLIRRAWIRTLRQFAAVGWPQHPPSRCSSGCRRHGRGRFGAVGSDRLAHRAVGCMLGLVAWLLRLSGLVSFISETILTGFKAGAALTIALTQLPKLFGVAGGGDNFFERALDTGNSTRPNKLRRAHLGRCSTHGGSRSGTDFCRADPIALAVVVISIVVVSLADLDEYGVSVVGALPPGLPDLAWPALRFRDVDGVMPLAAACFLLGYVESISAARTLAVKNGYEINPRKNCWP